MHQRRRVATLRKMEGAVDRMQIEGSPLSGKAFVHGCNLMMKWAKYLTLDSKTNRVHNLNLNGLHFIHFITLQVQVELYWNYLILFD